MQPTLVREPFHRPAWIYEEKYDGWRMLAFKDGLRVRLISRQGIEHTERFREVAEAIAELKASTLILDGEVCVFDRDLVSQFHLLDRPSDELCTPPVFMAFDCLHVHGLDVRGLPLHRRRYLLDQELTGAKFVYPARRLPDNGLVAWTMVKERGYEGLVAKDERSPYRGGMTRSWVKVKVRYEGVFIVGGILGPAEAPEGLLVGERVGRRLVYRGVVEWGVRRAVVADLLKRARVVSRSPFQDGPDTRRATWLDQRVKVELTYNEMMEGRLRDPVLRRLPA